MQWNRGSKILRGVAAKLLDGSPNSMRWGTRKSIITTICVFTVLVGVVPGLSRPAEAQSIGVQTPFQTYSDSFYRRTGVNFGFRLNNGAPGFGSRIVGIFPNNAINPAGLVFGQNGATSAIPPFGGYDPNADARFGFQRAGSNGAFSLGLTMGKGSTRTASMQSPSVVVPNGGTASFGSGQSSPFITSVTPVIGFGNTLPPAISAPPIFPDSDRTGMTRDYSALRAALSQIDVEPPKAPPTVLKVAYSSAQHGDLSVSEIKQRRLAAVDEEKRQNQNELTRLVQSAADAESKGNIDLALLNLYKAGRLATGKQKVKLKKRYDALNLTKKRRSP